MSALSSKVVLAVGSPFSEMINLDLPRDANFNRLGVSKASIPKSYYMLDQSVILPFLEETAGGGAVQLILVAGEEGNYNVTGFRALLEIMLEAASVTAGNSFTYTVGYDADSGLLDITCSNAAGFVLTNLQSPFSKYMGLRLSDGTDQKSGPGGVCLSTYPINFQRYEVLQIRSSLARNYDDNILANILVADEPYGGTIEYLNEAMDYEKVNSSGSKSATHSFILTDSQGRKVPMNGQAIKLVLVLWFEH